ncbi:type II toxin-antitoxin system RelE/ParE family toxin [Erwinia tracheiphila]|uniref:Killer protein n=1 Tax=Erwinia tracheiphila TaxID=65700 RepID=A0A0M2KGC6_9GAMM|nr:type II toxin-antitoxin system RelE/ParE family toxin [Erwinia tracheiphila]EOS94816.1 plasmid maintenance system killer protein [Erwinia tracheiphila PSU-1]KKF35976.1 Killer protein [Erwinia tracheiphila]UIA87293.1 type II toxin-antitoxin system RelE/ParE family toxin [Erwinia tracheiphila]UIA95656.1 type II toxin-antitoxin system RelE/ParE family toxin [Erwinia tracheiphila]
MIKSFKHKGLRLFFETDSTAGIMPQHTKKLKVQLAVLNQADKVSDLDLPGYRLHPLKGDRDGIWSITVNGNWRITFEFHDGDAHIVNYEDYH